MDAKYSVVKTARFQSNGIHHVTVINDEEELSKAYFDFAYFHSRNAAEMYENAVSVLPMPEQKALFLQLACRKREVLTRLKMERSDTIVSGNSARKSGTGSYVKYLMDTELSPQTTLKESFDFAYTKETKTLALYEKMASAAHIDSARALFEYLIESQRGHIHYLDSQVAISNGDLNRPVHEMAELEYA